MPESSPSVLVLTALAAECEAVLDHIEERQEIVHPGGTRLTLGRLPGTPWQVALGELIEGATATAALTASLIDWLQPQAVLFVGVAGSLKDDIGIGDVVVGTKVYGVHGAKVTAEGPLVRPEAWFGSHALVQAARSAVRDMTGVRAHFKPIATGDIVLADADAEIARYLRQYYNDAAAIEMEGSGVAQAAHLSGQVDALVIRGISDRADARKSEADAGGSQGRAARQAASVAVSVLRKYRPRGRGSSTGSEEEPQGTYGGDHFDFRGGTFYGPVVGKQTRGR
ncbi:5'-methylthioadenosine/S-adenosylhomocysteine nucleosidase family protein [Streptomyces sp. NPDC001348]